MSECDYEGVTHFPMKLWDVVDDPSCDIFRWGADGTSFFVDDVRYENEIMERYPGFVQISSFANLRRLLREYSFTWKNNESGDFEFSHESFLKGERGLIVHIKTKRKSAQLDNGQPVKQRRRSGLLDGSKPKNSSKSWLQPVAAGSLRLRMETLMRFPEKFWAVVNDPNDLLYWGEDGVSVIVDDKKYEEEIMKRYPGFVQINSFANLRRLLREYGFSWSIRDNGFFEFSHANMKRDRPDLISGIKTKRKALKAGLPHPYLPYYRVESPFFGMARGFAEFDPNFRSYSSPEVSQAIGAIQYSSANNDFGTGTPVDSTYKREPHHSAGDHSLQQSIYHGLQPYHYVSCQTVAGMQPNANHSWSAQSSGDKLEPQFYYWSDPHLTLSNHQAGEQEESAKVEETQEEISASAAQSNEAIYQVNHDRENYAGIASEEQHTNLTSARLPTSVDMHTPPYTTMCMIGQQQTYPHGFYEPNVYQPLFHPHYQTSCHTHYKDESSLEDTDFDNISLTSPPEMSTTAPSNSCSPVEVVDLQCDANMNLITNNKTAKQVEEIGSQMPIDVQTTGSQVSVITGRVKEPPMFPETMKVINML